MYIQYVTCVCYVYMEIYYFLKTEACMSLNVRCVCVNNRNQGILKSQLQTHFTNQYCHIVESQSWQHLDEVQKS